MIDKSEFSKEMQLTLLGGIQPPGQGNRPQRLFDATHGALGEITRAGQKTLIEEFGPSPLRKEPRTAKPVKYSATLADQLAGGPSWVWVQQAVAELLPFVSVTKDGSGVEIDVGATDTIILPHPTDSELKAAVEDLFNLQQAAKASGQERREQVLAQAHDAAVAIALALELDQFPSDAVLHLFDVLEFVLARAVFDAKRILNVERPAVIGQKYGIAINEVLDRPNHTSLPSSHSAFAHALERLCVKCFGLDGAKKAYLQDVAARIAKNRELAGLHTLLDSEAGKQIGYAVADFVFDSSTRMAKFPKLACLVGVSQEFWNAISIGILPTGEEETPLSAEAV